ncbi:MAG TPA: hypothetical protein VFD56_04385 [Chitinophagaceae bacterium]|nr:hypothetical protein [Chitinophagaceae bacterium]
MLEQITQLVKQYGKEAVIDNPDIPNEDNNAVLAEATSTITGGMQNMLAGGGLQDIISMFTGGKRGQNKQKGGIGGLLKNPMVVMMIGHFISKLVTKFKMNPAQASSLSNNLIPNVLSELVNRTNSTAPPDSNFDFNDLIGSLTGGNATIPSAGGINLNGILEQLTNGGNDDNGGGEFDLQDIVSQVTRGAQQKQEQQARGNVGMSDLIKGFFN